MLYGADADCEALTGGAVPLEFAMTDLSLNDALDNVYASLKADNHDIEAHIAALKSVLAREQLAEAVFDPARLAQNNRQGRKLMQSYFKKRGVVVRFAS